MFELWFWIQPNVFLLLWFFLHLWLCIAAAIVVWFEIIMFPCVSLLRANMSILPNHKKTHFLTNNCITPWQRLEICISVWKLCHDSFKKPPSEHFLLGLFLRKCWRKKTLHECVYNLSRERKVIQPEYSEWRHVSSVKETHTSCEEETTIELTESQSEEQSEIRNICEVV